MAVAQKYVLVVGDVMIDHTVYGKTSRLAPEAPVPVLLSQHEERVLGGAGNVLRSLVDLQPEYTLVPLMTVGSDLAGSWVRAELKRLAVTEAGLAVTEDAPTTTKTRLYCEDRLVSRFDVERRTDVGEACTARWTDLWDRTWKHDCAAVVVSDYHKGVVGLWLKRILQDCANLGVPTFVDPKHNQASVYGPCSILKPNVFELWRLAGRASRTLPDLRALGDRNYVATLLPVAERVRREVGAFHLFVTLGPLGILHVHAQGYCVYQPPHNNNVRDVVGAGDTTLVCAVYSVLLARLNPMSASFVKNMLHGGDCAVAFTGNFTMSRPVFELIRRGLPANKLILVAPDTLHWSQDAVRAFAMLQRARRKTLAVANGCFDLCHAGHIRLLNFADCQADILVVAVNTDRSVRQLKGPRRPVMTLEKRITWLCQLPQVDYVVAFDENTPEALLAALRPDVLVKGADYHGRPVLGRELVGRVALAPLLEEFSTTRIVDEMENK